jgi:hypothetical protein
LLDLPALLDLPVHRARQAQLVRQAQAWFPG